MTGTYQTIATSQIIDCQLVGFESCAFEIYTTIRTGDEWWQASILWRGWKRPCIAACVNTVWWANSVRLESNKTLAYNFSHHFTCLRARESSRPIDLAQMKCSTTSQVPNEPPSHYSARRLRFAHESHYVLVSLVPTWQDIAAQYCKLTENS